MLEPRPDAPTTDRALLRKAGAVIFIGATAWPLFASHSPLTTWVVVHVAWVLAIALLAVPDRAAPTADEVES